jgi:hypothetical protein
MSKEGITIYISDDHIKEELACMGFEAKDILMLRGYLRAKINDEADESGSSHLCKLIQNLLNLAYEDDLLIRRKPGE